MSASKEAQSSTGGASAARTGAPLSMLEVAKHSRAEDCWVVIHNTAYDLTQFLPQHPGGADIILPCTLRTPPALLIGCCAVADAAVRCAWRPHSA